MGPIEIIVIIAGVLIVGGVTGFAVRRKIKGRKGGCCGDCAHCAGCRTAKKPARKK